jgi:alkylation response protein AidB-like acyl-CoA dehydrogenase
MANSIAKDTTCEAILRYDVDHPSGERPIGLGGSTSSRVFSRPKKAGLFRLLLPRRLGGPELSPADFTMVVEAAARLDGSVGWVVGNGAGASRIAGYIEDGAARALLGTPGAFMVTATGAVGQAAPTDGGYRVSGRWPFGSGLSSATLSLACAPSRIIAALRRR